MEPLGHLSVLLASFSALPWLVFFTGPQGRSVVLSSDEIRVSLSPSHRIFVQGEQVLLNCIVPEGQKAESFIFYEKEMDDRKWIQKENTLEIPITHSESKKIFTCCYKKKSSFLSSSRTTCSDKVVVSVIESPRPPNLSLQPQHPIYIQGEGITLNCSVSTELPLTGYTFYEEQGGQFFEVQPKGLHNTFTLDGTTTGMFCCVYWIQISGREIQSQRSSSVSVTRTESPGPPTVSLHPHYPVYIQGEEVTLFCSAPKEVESRGYIFYHAIGGKVLRSLPENHNATFRVEEGTVGKYSCVYWALVSGRKIQSQWSKSIYVNRTDPLQPPELKVDPLSGAVNEGKPLFISCLTNRSNTEKRFHFYKDGTEMDSSNEGSLRTSGEPENPSPNTTLRILQANSSHSGEFACSYEENMKSRWIFSPRSQKVNITVHAQNSSVLALGYTSSTLLFILMVSFGCCYLWRRKRASKVQNEFPPQQRNEEETDCLERPELQMTAFQQQTETRLRMQVEEDGVSYSEIQFQPNELNSVEEVSQVLYSNLQFQPTHGLKPVEKDQVLYSELYRAK